MMIGYTVEARGLDEQIALLEKYDRLADDEMVDAVKKGSHTIEANWKRIAPVGVSSRYRNTIGSVIEVKPNLVIGRIGPSVKIYPAVQEFGRRPGKAPPPGALDRWVYLVLGIPKDEAPGVAFRIGQKHKRGWKRTRAPRTPARTAWRLSRKKVNQYFKDALESLLKKVKHHGS